MPIRNLQKFHGQIICGIGCEKGPTPGVEIPVIPDEPDVLDGGDVVGGVGGGGLATGLSWVVLSFVHIPLTAEQLVRNCGTRTPHRLPEHGYLLPERQIFKAQLALRFE